MTIQQDFEQIKAYVQSKGPDLRVNGELIDILEGNLYQYIDKLLRKQLSEQSYDQAKHRISSINLLKKIIDKLATIYTPAPQRSLHNGNAKDKEMFDWYVANSNLGTAMKTACENFVLAKCSIIQPLIHEEKLLLRVIQNDSFLVMSNDDVDSLCPTHMIGIMGTTDKPEYLVWTEDQVLKLKADGETDQDYMNSIENPDGVNIYGELPFVYINGSARKLMPPADVDLQTIVCLLPLLLSDLNYAVMFQCFSIVYGINVDDAGLKRAPNAFWALKSDATTDAKPEVGCLKPQVDIDQVLSLIQSELSLFLNSRGIKPGAVGHLSAGSFASGLSKMVDELDSVEIRQKLVTVFTDAEKQLWDFILHTGHPIWIKDSAESLPFAVEFSKDCFVDVRFDEQLPLTSRGQLVIDQKAELDAGFTTKKRAVQTLNPEMSEEDLNAFLLELEKEKNVNKVAANTSQNSNGSVGVGSGVIS